MSVRDANSFLDKLKSDPDFAKQVTTAQSNAATQVAKSAGLSFSPQDIVDAQKTRAQSGDATANRVVDWVGAGAGIAGTIAGTVGAAAAAA
jgi:predicted ribosomally synthesized peptide with nif11-like leader